MEDILERPIGFWKTIREFWKTGKTGVALFLISIFALIYGYIALEFEVGRGWNGHESVQNVMKDISSFVPVGGTIVAMIIGGIDFMMLLADFIQARREKRIEAATAVAKEEGKEEGKAEGIAEGKAEGIAEGIAEGKAEGIVEGKAEERELWKAWNNRRLEAEAKGQEFNEPPPNEIEAP